jgi:hypothetical protein
MAHTSAAIAVGFFTRQADARVPGRLRPQVKLEHRGCYADQVYLAGTLPSSGERHGTERICRIADVAVAHIYACIGIIAHALPALGVSARKPFLSF